MSAGLPSYQQKQEKAAVERREAQEHTDREQMVAALQRIAELQEASDKEAKRADRFHRLAEKLTLRLERRKYWVDLGGAIGIFVAAAVATWAVLDAHSSSDKQYKALKDQQRAMQGQLAEMQTGQRPWVFADVSPGGPFYDTQQHGLGITAVFTIHNFGKLPATDVRVHAASSDQGLIADGKAFMNAACEDRIVHGSATAGVIFPDQRPVIVNYGFGLTEAQWRDASKANTAGILPTIAGCITYLAVGSTKVHHTWFYLNAIMVKPQSNGVYILPSDPRNLPPEQIRIFSRPEFSKAD